MSTVYILGAGSSAGFDRSYTSLRCPSAKNFFTVAWQMLKEDPDEAAEHYGSLFFFLKKYYRLSPAGLEKAGLDMQDVLTFLDLELDYSDSDEEISLLQKARNQFMDLLSITFSKALDGPPCPYHGALASALKPGDAVISFNYDLLMDCAMELNCPDWDFEAGYGFQASVAAGPKRSPRAPSKVTLLKPHGSFNWVACMNCGGFYFLPPERNGVLFRWDSFGNFFPEPPGHRLERLIVPPSIKKDVHGKAMQQVWNKARQVLETASRVVIIGYSLPAADFLVKRLFYRSLHCSRNLRELELVDRNNDPSRPNPLMEKYRSMLGDARNSVKIICDKKNIGEYTRFSEIQR